MDIVSEKTQEEPTAEKESEPDINRRTGCTRCRPPPSQYQLPVAIDGHRFHSRKSFPSVPPISRSRVYSDALRFKKSDLQQEGQVPKVDQRFSYETSEVDGGKKHAVNLQHQQSDGQNQKEQARKQQG